MEWVAVIAGSSASIAALCRVAIVIYALRGTKPEHRPSIIQALGRMFREIRPLPPLPDRKVEPPAINSEQKS